MISSFSLLAHVVDPLGVRIVVVELMADHGQVVVQRLHVGIELGLDVARQIAEIAIAQRHHRSSQQNLPIALPAFERRGQGQNRLSRSRRADQRDQLDVVVGQRFEGE